jgi:hypothetical protein
VVRNRVSGDALGIQGAVTSSFSVRAGDGAGSRRVEMRCGGREWESCCTGRFRVQRRARCFTRQTKTKKNKKKNRNNDSIQERPWQCRCTFVRRRTTTGGDNVKSGRRGQLRRMQAQPYRETCYSLTIDRSPRPAAARLPRDVMS